MVMRRWQISHNEDVIRQALRAPQLSQLQAQLNSNNVKWFLQINWKTITKRFVHAVDFAL